ncbi:MAG: site-specific integrase [Nitrospiraceae bacterium]|nr:site-specific integrase [Nitrospiraceae bacterium]
MEELQRFMDGLIHLPDKSRAYLVLLIMTGCRMGEARQMRWTDLDPISRLWRKPRTKNGSSHVVPLPLQVMEAIRILPKVSQWVFPGVNGAPWSEASAHKMWSLVRSRWNMVDVRLHDLRRTCASYLAIQGENLPVIQSVLNHRSLAPTSIYARLNTKVTDRALQAQADRFCIVLPNSGLIEQVTPSGLPEHEVVPAVGS